MSVVYGAAAVAPRQNNIVINGNFDFWDHDTQIVSVPGTTETLTASRFMFEYDIGGVVDINRSTDVPTIAQSGVRSEYSYQIDVTTNDTPGSTDFAYIEYVVEGYDARILFNQKFVISFWVKSPKTGTHAIAFRNAAPDRYYIAEYTVNAANTWEKKVVAVPASPADGTWNFTNKRGLEIRWALHTGSFFAGTVGAWTTGIRFGSTGSVNVFDTIGNKFHLAQIKLEPGEIATPFDERPIGHERALLNRYVQAVEPIFGGGGPIGVGYFSTTSRLNAWYSFGTRFRSTPLLTVKNATHFEIGYQNAVDNAVTAISNGEGTEIGKELLVDGTGTPFTVGQAGFFKQGGAGDLIFSAESFAFGA